MCGPIFQRDLLLRDAEWLLFAAMEKKAMIPPVLSFPPANVSDGTKHEPRLVGRVAMVNTEGHFVLLECDAWTPPAEERR
jgi:hypothetical protein